MKTAQEKQYEYDKFMFEFFHKIEDIQRDYNKLSSENKYRVKNELEKTVGVYGLTDILKHKNMLR